MQLQTLAAVVVEVTAVAVVVDTEVEVAVEVAEVMKEAVEEEAMAVVAAAAVAEENLVLEIGRALAVVTIASPAVIHATGVVLPRMVLEVVVEERLPMEEIVGVAVTVAVTEAAAVVVVVEVEGSAVKAIGTAHAATITLDGGISATNVGP